jgi:tight adherence protein B
MTGTVAAAAGMALTAGLIALLAGLRRSWAPRSTRDGTSLAETWGRLTRRPAGRQGRRRDAILVVSIAIGFALDAVTGWILAVVVLPLLALGLPYLLILPKQRDVELLEALDRWVRSLAAVLTRGRSNTDAVRISRRTAPPAINDELGLLVARLNNRWDTGDALRAFADDLSSADVDAVVAALILASNRGSNGASVTLHALADSLQDQLKARRVIESERAKPYVVVRQVTVITVAALTLVLLTNHSFFAPYTTPLGQLIFAVLICMYAGALVLMRRKAQQRPRERILLGRQR